MRFKKSPQIPGAGRTRAWHHHESHTPSPGAILLAWGNFTGPFYLVKWPKQIRRQCMLHRVSKVHIPYKTCNQMPNFDAMGRKENVYLLSFH